MPDKPEQKDWWDKADVLLKVLGIIVVAVLGGCFNSALKDREINAKMVEVAVGVLKATPEEASKPLRVWAIDVVNKCSRFPLPKEAEDVLKTNALPAVRYLSDEHGNVITDEKGNRIILE